MTSLSTPIFALVICGVLPFAQSSSAVPKELDIISGEGSERNENTRIENAFDGKEGTTKKECYFNDKNEPKEATFKIDTAVVEMVKLLGRAEEGRNNWNMVDTVVEVCTDGISDCKPCGTVTETPAMGEYAEVECAEGAQGDTVRLTSTSRTKYLQICEIKVVGFGGPCQIKVLEVNSDGKYFAFNSRDIINPNPNCFPEWEEEGLRVVKKYREGGRLYVTNPRTNKSGRVFAWDLDESGDRRWATKGDSMGRFDPVGNREEGDFKVGDILDVKEF